MLIAALPIRKRAAVTSTPRSDDRCRRGLECGDRAAACECGGVPDYDAFARDFDAHAQDSAYNAHYDRPAMLDLLGPVDGLRVLDAGCGSGLYAKELLAAGATVSGFDASADLIQIARQRLGPQVDLRVHDLNAPLHWIHDGSVDRVVMALVLHHLPDPQPALRELHRVLTSNGRLVVSTVHPTADWLRLGGSYFTDEMVTETWNEGWLVHFRRAPLEAVMADFTNSGFVIERLIEPRPAASMAQTYPDVHERLSQEPGFVALRLAKQPTHGTVD